MSTDDSTAETMNTDDSLVLGRKASVGTLLDHPLIGISRLRTLVVLGYLAVLIGLFVVSYVGSTVTVDGVVLDTLTLQFDHVSTVLIVFVAATITIVPFLYALWNGGPVLSFVLPLVPTLLGDLAAGRYVLDVDMAIALTVGGTASAIAILVADIRRTKSVRPWQTEIDEYGLLVVTMAVVVAAAGVGQFVTTAPPRNVDVYAAFGGLWLVPLVVLGRYWLAILRTVVTARTGHDRVES